MLSKLPCGGVWWLPNVGLNHAPLLEATPRTKTLFHVKVQQDISVLALVGNHLALGN
ncbi:MAG: hypothetical protein KME45_22135 [Stenomitos rutilans HA7619-LM2]|jgi:hypothetical protein|nr:hypothetical protein [Stenomitos rutilans HA7619-LM2]